MLNTNSPIVQSLGGMSQGIPPNTAMGSNMIGIGNNGYNQQQNNGGYYNGGNYYYNPFVQQHQEKLRIAKEREELRQQSDMWKMISKKVNTILGNEIDDEKLKELYDPKFIESYNEDAIETPITTSINIGGKEKKFVCGKGNPVPMFMEAQGNSNLMNLHLNWTGVNMQVNNSIQRMNQMYDAAKERFPDDMSLSDYLSRAGELYVEAIIDKGRQFRKDKTQVYSTNDYSQLINTHSNRFFPEVFGNANIGDMEVRLPDHLKNERQARKEQFLSSIFNRDRGI